MRSTRATVTSFTIPGMPRSRGTFEAHPSLGDGSHDGHPPPTTIATFLAAAASWYDHTDFPGGIMRINSHIRSRRGRPATAVGVALVALAAGSGTAYAATSHNEQVVLHNTSNAQADAKSSINGTAQVSSYDGRFVVFSTTAALVGRDRNQVDDVYLRDTLDGITILVSTKGRTIGNDSSFEPTISNDGRFVAFTTMATNLFRDTNGGTLDVAVKDLYTGKLTVASVDSAGKQRQRNSFFPVLAGNGKRVAFQTFGAFGTRDGDKREDVYLHALGRGWTRQVSLTDSGKDVAASVLVGDVSDNGTRVTFGDANDLWVRDTSSGRTTRFWHEPDGPPCQPFPTGSAGRPAISGNGAYVAFATCATKIPGSDGQATQVYRMNLSTGDIMLVSLARRRRTCGRVLVPAVALAQRALRRLRLRGDRPGAGRHGRP